MSFEPAEFGGFDFACDYCPFEEWYDGETFKESWALAKESGWRAIRDEENDEWLHKCPACLARIENDH